MTSLAIPRTSQQQAAAVRGAGNAPLVAHLRRPTAAFDLLGATWRQGENVAGLVVMARALGPEGWSDWTKLQYEADEGPSAAEDSSVRDGTAPVWFGDSNGVEVSVYSPSGTAPRDLDIAAIDPGTSSYDSLAAAEATSEDASLERTSATASTSSASAPAFPRIPRIITRAQWGADESLGNSCDAPRYGRTFKMVFVHHTAGSNDYSESESASIVRAILAYHTQSRGWCDIGYNFLVDKYGNIFEGRDGGMRRPVRGAHAGDYNVNSTGISMMGNFDEAYPTAAMKHALVRLIGWRLGTAYHSGFGKADVNGKRFQRISGHRDAMSTACPGAHAYAWLPTLRARVTDYLSNFSSPIRNRWEQYAAASGSLGSVREGEQIAGGGRYTVFRGGYGFQSPTGVNLLLRGVILTRYLEVGGVHSSLGYPTTPVYSPRPGALAAGFAGGRLYWSKATGIWAVREPLLSAYYRAGGPNGSLGLPVGATWINRDGRGQRFAHGIIRWQRSTDTTTVTYL